MTTHDGQFSHTQKSEVTSNTYQLIDLTTLGQYLYQLQQKNKNKIVILMFISNCYIFGDNFFQTIMLFLYIYIAMSGYPTASSTTHFLKQYIPWFIVYAAIIIV